MATRRWSSKRMRIRSGLFCGSIYWVLLVSGRVSVPKPLSQIQRSTRWLLQGLSPKPSFGGFGLNGAVERAQRTHTEEFYEVVEFSLGVDTINQELQAWERIYNTVRPHQALGYLTPQQFLRQWQSQQKEAECH